MSRPTMGWPEPQPTVQSVSSVTTPSVSLGATEPDPSTSGIKSSGSPISSDNGKDGKERNMLTTSYKLHHNNFTS